MPDLLRDLRQWVCDHPTFTDTLVAAVLSAGALFQMGAGIPLGRGIDPPDLLSATIAVAGTAPIALRRRAPVTVLAVQVAVGIATMAGGLNYGITWGELLAFLMGIYTVAAYRGLAHSAAAGAAAIGLAVVDMFVSEQRVGLWDITVSTAFLTGTWFLGRTLRLRRAYLAELTARAERLERAREADARAVRAEERSRIARELHDVVAHHVSVMTVQAGAARRILDRDPDRAVEALSNIEKMGRTALGEMRRVVGMLRVGPDGDHGLPAAGDRSPQPGIHEVDELVQQLRETGLEVKMRVEGRPRMLSPGVDLAAYRLIQEALTNTLKHAGRDVRASVVIRYEGAQLAVRVEDDGRAGIASLARAQAGTRAEPEAGSGHGLVGMRERVALYGGELRVGPRAGGGFEVRARFPLEA